MSVCGLSAGPFWAADRVEPNLERWFPMTLTSHRLILFQNSSPDHEYRCFYYSMLTGSIPASAFLFFALNVVFFVSTAALWMQNIKSFLQVFYKGILTVRFFILQIKKHYGLVTFVHPFVRMFVLFNRRTNLVQISRNFSLGSRNPTILSLP